MSFFSPQIKVYCRKVRRTRKLIFQIKKHLQKEKRPFYGNEVEKL